MPAIYAHYKMGRETVDLLNDEFQNNNWVNVIEKYRELFDIGVHGPDIFFYYYPLKENKIRSMGSEIHKKSLGYFLENAIKMIKRKKNKEPYIAYLFGFICHFSLDTISHPLIRKCMEKAGLTHNKVEVEYDRSLMCLDGENPLKYILTKHINATPYNAKIIYEFYKDIYIDMYKGNTEYADIDNNLQNNDEFKAIDVYKALKGIIDYNKLLHAPSSIKRNVLRVSMKGIGVYDDIGGFIIGRKPHPKCVINNKKLYVKMEYASRLAIKIMENIEQYLVSDNSHIIEDIALIDIYRLPEQIWQDFNGMRIEDGKVN